LWKNFLIVLIAKSALQGKKKKDLTPLNIRRDRWTKNYVF